MSTALEAVNCLSGDEQSTKNFLSLNAILLGAACFVACILAALAAMLLNGPFAFDAGRLVPPGVISMAGLMNSGIIKDFLFRGIVVGGILVQYRTIIILVLAALILVFVRLAKAYRRDAAGLPEYPAVVSVAGAGLKPQLTSLVGTGNMETGDIILVKLWRWLSGIWRVFRLAPETIAMTL